MMLHCIVVSLTCRHNRCSRHVIDAITCVLFRSVLTKSNNSTVQGRCPWLKTRFSFSITTCMFLCVKHEFYCACLLEKASRSIEYRIMFLYTLLSNNWIWLLLWIRNSWLVTISVSSVFGVFLNEVYLINWNNNDNTNNENRKFLLYDKRHHSVAQFVMGVNSVF